MIEYSVGAFAIAAILVPAVVLLRFMRSRRTMLGLAIALISGTSARAVEIDFAAQLVDLENNTFRDCAKPNRTDPNNITCDEWVYHTLGLVAFGALDQPEPCAQGKPPMECALSQARRAVLARKIYPGKNEKHIVDLSTSEITLILENVGRLTLRSSTEMLRVVEMLDPARLK